MKTKILISAIAISLAASGCSNPSAIPNLTVSQALSSHQKDKEEQAEGAESKEETEVAVASEPAAAEDPTAADAPQGDRALTEVQVSETSGGSGELWRWNLEVGESYQLHYEGTTDVEMSFGGEMGSMMQGMMGGSGLEDLSDQIRMRTELELQVERILPDGRYDLRIPINRMVIESASGDSMTLTDLPEDVRVLRAYMTPRGTVEFYERVMVEVRDDGAYGIARMSEDGTSSEIQLGGGGMEMTARAEVDPKTGRVTLSQEVREQQPRTRQVEEERPVQYLDVLPADVLTLLELPEGPVAAGDSLQVESIAGIMKMDAGEPVQCSHSRCGELRIRLDVDSGSMNQAVAQAHQQEDDGFDDMGMDDDFGDMDEMHADMHMPGMGGGGDEAAMAMQPTMKADVDATILFDVAAGRLFNIEGTSGSVSGSAGVEIREATEFTLIFLE